MLEVLNYLFAGLCGQNPAHTWAPGGVLLPVCQRCTGLYVGAGVAAFLLLRLRPRLSGRFLWVHGAFLLLMVPFGFHWLPQGPILRAITGVLFGFGSFTFLWLPASRLFEALTPSGPTNADGVRLRAYGFGLGMTLFLTPFLAMRGGSLAAVTLLVLICWGAAALAGVTLLDSGLFLAAAKRLLFRTSRTPVPL